MKKTITTLLSMAALVASTTASAVLIDFESDGMNALNPGDIITDQTLFGATFSVENQGMTGGNPRELILFNADCIQNVTCTGGDNDLSLPGEGNILIISQDNDLADPNDSAAGGTIVVDFATQVSAIESITVDVGDSDVGPNFFQVFLNNVLVDQINLALGGGQNNVQTANFAGGPFDELRLVLAGSGGLVSVDFTPVPLPAALPLFMAGLLGLFGMRRRNAS